MPKTSQTSPFGPTSSNTSPPRVDFASFLSATPEFPYLIHSSSTNSNESPTHRSPRNQDSTLNFLNVAYPDDGGCSPRAMDVVTSPCVSPVGGPDGIVAYPYGPGPGVLSTSSGRLIRSVSDEIDTHFPRTEMDMLGTGIYGPPVPIKLEAFSRTSSSSSSDMMDYDDCLPEHIHGSPALLHQVSYRKYIPMQFDAEITQDFPANWNENVGDLKKKIISSVRQLSGSLLEPSQVIIRDWDSTLSDRHHLTEYLKPDKPKRTLQVFFQIFVLDEGGQERELICEWKVSGLCKRASELLRIDGERLACKFGQEIVDSVVHIFFYINNPKGLLRLVTLDKPIRPKLEAPETSTSSSSSNIPAAPTLNPSMLIDPTRPTLQISRRDKFQKQFPPPDDIVEVTDSTERRKNWCRDCQQEANVQRANGEKIIVRCNWIRVWRPRVYEVGKPRKYYSCNQPGCRIAITKDLHAKRSHAHNHAKNFKSTHVPLEFHE